MQGTRKRLEEEQHICTYIGQLLISEQSTLQKNNKEYFEMLQLYKLQDKAISPSFSFPVYKKLLLVIGSPLFIIGYFLNSLPVITAKKITSAKVQRVDFYSWIYLSSAMFLYLTWIMILFLGFMVRGLGSAFCLVLITIASGIFVHNYLNYYKDFIQVRRLKKLREKDPSTLKQLQQLRKRIIEMI